MSSQTENLLTEGSVRGQTVTFRSTSSRETLPDVSLIAGLARDAIDLIVHDPLSSGFLRKYCDKHFCSESIKFITEIDRFRDQFIRDRLNWSSNKSWRTIDEELNLSKTVFTEENFNSDRDFLAPLRNRTLVSPSDWPSEIISYEATIESIIKIWDRFLRKDAPYWICIPYSALLNTMRRIKYLHIYGSEVFMEALKDPIKTIEKDIYPRFILSEEYRLMLNCMRIFNEESPNPRSLKLSKPPFVILQRYQLIEIEKNVIKFTLQDLLEDQILYTEFLKYLEKVIASENLLCIRAVRMFKDSMFSQIPHERAKSLEYAWIVYRFFIASGSPYEISISHREKKEILRHLADPPYPIFDSIEQSTLTALQTHFAAFSLTKEYQELYHLVTTKRNAITSTPALMTASSRLSMKLPSVNYGENVRSSCFSMN
jgi:hypothetical protein